MCQVSDWISYLAAFLAGGGATLLGIKLKGKAPPSGSNIRNAAAGKKQP
jgi:hypothetical protein